MQNYSIEINGYRDEFLHGIALMRKEKRASDGNQSIEYDYDC